MRECCDSHAAAQNLGPGAADWEIPMSACEDGAHAIRVQAEGLARLADSLNGSFEQAVARIMATEGRLVVTGMGKSGHIARKISATFASTGTPSLFVHPAEASHGDLGMIDRRDTVLALSKSGESPELGDVVTYCRRHRIPLLAITAQPDSALGRAADIVLALPDMAEACPLGLAPTTSTTMTLALGDALAVVCLRRRNFRAANFREFHPGGKLGQKLARVRDIMHSGEALPLVPLSATVGDAILEMTRGRFGCVGVLDADGHLAGVFTDGDLRRSFSAAVIDRPIAALMTADPKRIDPDALVADVAYLFTSRRIPSVFATADGKPVGIVHIHDLLGSGFV